MRRLLSFAIYLLANATGVVMMLLPFLMPATFDTQGQGAGLTLTLVAGLSFLALLLETQQGIVSVKFTALLGVLVAMNAMLRFIEVAIPGPGGFSPVFFLIILTGYTFGARFGFLMGSLTIMISALVTGGVGPWLPFQILTAGWVGLSAGALHPVVRKVPGLARYELILVTIFSAIWGLLYGIVINLWFWPFAVGPTNQTWEAGVSIWETMKRYAAFYLASSFIWDLSRAVGNGAMVLAFGEATLRVLRRFHRRFTFEYHPETAAD